MEWHFESDRPIYTQLMEQMQRRVLAGVYAPGSRVPGVRELAAEAGVNPNTMQRALADLETQGLLCTQSTNGRFVTNDTGYIRSSREALAKATTQGYLSQMNALGCSYDETTQYLLACKPK